MFDYSYDSKAEVFEHQFNQEEVERLNSLRSSGYGPLECLLSVLADRQPAFSDACECVQKRYAGSADSLHSPVLCLGFDPLRRTIKVEWLGKFVGGRPSMVGTVRSALRGFDLQKLVSDYPRVVFTITNGGAVATEISFPSDWLITGL